MKLDIVADIDPHRLNCTGSLTKFVTSFVCLSFLAEKYKLEDIINDLEFLDKLAITAEAKSFLDIFQKTLGDKFSIHDLCSYYAGLPYTFDLAKDELEKVEKNEPFKHHSIRDEETFLDRCKNNIIPVYKPRSKFHYSELCIIFLGYFIEKAFQVKMEELYEKYVIQKFDLKESTFSRTIVNGAYIQDLSDEYDYPAIAIQNHGYFCYSNGYYTTLYDVKKLIEKLSDDPVYQLMTNLDYARAASNRLMNGFTVEIRKVKDDFLNGYEGLSFSGCTLWATSTKRDKGYVTFSDNEEKVYETIYDELFQDSDFDIVPENTQVIYKNFLSQYKFDYELKEIPVDFQGNYHRVRINEKELNLKFKVGDHFIVIRNPDEVKYDVVYYQHQYRIKGKDKVHGATVGFYTANSGNRYMFFDGNLYRKESCEKLEGDSPDTFFVSS